MCCYWNCWCHMIYLFLCYHRLFTWIHPWRSSRFTFSCVYIGTPLGDTLGGILGFLFCVFIPVYDSFVSFLLWGIDVLLVRSLGLV